MNQKIAAGVIAACCLVVAAGCDNGPGKDQGDVYLVATVGTVPFTSAFRLVDSVRLAAAPDNPIVRISGLARDGDGRFILSDPTAATVRLFAADGGHVLDIGRRGDGPGEFRLPIYPHVDAMGRIHVADAARKSITAFTRDGELVRTTRLDALSRMDQFDLAPDGGYVVAGRADLEDQQVLFHVDTVGRIVRRWLPLGSVVPGGGSENELWNFVRRPSVAVVGETAYVVNTLLDSIWVVDLRGGTARSTSVPLHGYEAPALPERELRAPPERQQWVNSLLLASTVFATDSGVIVPFARGTYFDGGSSALAYLGPDRRWRSLSGAPPLIGADHKSFFGLLTPADTEVVIGVFERR